MEKSEEGDWRRRQCLGVHGSSECGGWWRRVLFHELWCCTALALLAFQSLPLSRGESIVFQNPSSDRELPLQHMVVDRKNTGRVYIGAVNKLYELHPDLRLKNTVTTGPKEDNPECPGRTGCSVTRQATPSYNKALAILSKSSKLVECDSLYQGRCRLRNLYSIDQAGNDSGSIVANDLESSTVVFVGPGPPEPWKKDVLYVASTYTGLGTFRDEVPAVASRSLEPGSLFQVAKKTINSETQISIERSQRKKYTIEYVTGFSSGNYSYFVTRQPKLETGPSPYISKLVRLCNADQNYYSYTEVPLSCTKNGVDYNLVQDAYLAKPGFDLARSLGVAIEDDVMYAVFAEGDRQSTSAKRPTRNSGLCVFSVREIDRIFLDNIEMCNRGEVLTGLGYFKRSKKCLATRFPTGSEVSCGNEVNYPLGGQIPVRASPVLTTDTHLTSVVATTTHSYTVVFMGTSDGMLKKGVVESENYGFEYDEISVERGRMILADMDLDISGEYLFVLTQESVSKVKVHECQGRMRCMDCLSARDPYCGWCALENKCSIRSECRDVLNQHWLPYKDAQCTTISKVTPDKIELKKSRYLRLEVDNLPTIRGQLSCVFTVLGRSQITGATRNTDGTVSCPTPQRDFLPHIPPGRHSIVATLSVQIDQGPDFASTNFTFYDCSTYKSCSMCVQSAFPCDWCVESHLCTAGAEDDCRRSEHIINGLNRQGSTSRRGPSFCPHIYAPSPEIFVPSGSKQSILVQSKNVLDFQKDFQCEFKIGHSIHKRPATKVGEEIRCGEMEFVYFGNGGDNGTEEAELAVVWQRGKALDNVQNIRVIMYKCQRLANNCGLCLTLDSSKFSCGWCSDEKTCFTENECRSSLGRRVRPDSWLDRTNACPNPRITDFNPKSGPVAGGTEVTISGINLGRSFEDVRDVVQINNVACVPKEELYEVSSKIVCVTTRPVHDAVSSGPVVIKLKEDMKYVAVSALSFYYVDPVITGFEPREGPQAGGTDVRIKGNHMDTGSKVNGTIAGVPCEIQNRSLQELVCRTGRSTAQKSGAIVIFFDNEKEEFVKDTHFNYRSDPQITSARPEVSIVSGGLNVEVRGDNFKILQRVKMFASYAGTNYLSPELCDILSSEKINCKTPDLMIPNDPRLLPTMSRPLELQYGLELDGNVKELSQKPGFTELKVYPDPKLDEFPDSRIKYFKDDYLTINGQNLNAAASEEDVRIQIGTNWCNLTALAAPALTCKPPPERPDTLFEDSPHPEVIVLIGNREYKVGFLSYEKEKGEFLGIPMETIIAIAVAIGAFVLAIALLLFVLRRKSTRHLRQMKSLKQQMDTIEMKVASECKEAFAELQTSMSEMAQELQMGIPFLPYRDYSAGVLFPNTLNHPVLRDLEVEHQRIPMLEKGLRQFNQLLMNKTFLLTFVRTMEGNKYFLSKDRVYVGSLLMVILQEKMEYCTDILKTLLADLIEKTVEKRYQPKILFRRSESVAERMLAAWFTFLMHRYLIECAGQPLFMLYWAIKQQMEKGPQDAITQEARYSLSEEKLLRQSVDTQTLMVFVSGIENGQQASMETPVRVLDCDTITQVKEKCLDAIYRTTPYTHRPSANDLDLEWRTGVSGRLILQDLDMTTKTETGGWKRMNTLAHYKVTNNASLVLMPRQASMYNLSLLSERSDKSSTFSLKNSPTLSRALSPLAAGNHKDPETGYKIYHLVKPHEHHGEGGGQDKPKMVSEIYLTRLLTTKGTLQKFTEDLLEAIFSTAHRGSTLPLCIKYMFDFMDDQALSHGITDPEVVHAWKSNALPLRFWVNLLKNPHFVFDIPRPTKIEGCLSVVAQTLMDACSTQDHQLTKDSPSSKLLFARDILVYRDWVDKYYQDIRRTPAVSDQDMSAFLAEESRNHQQQGPQFNVYSALNELYQYLKQYKEQMATALEEDEFSRRNRLPTKFQQMIMIMEGDVYANS